MLPNTLYENKEKYIILKVVQMNEKLILNKSVNAYNAITNKS